MGKIDTKDVAKLVREELKKHFPHHKFSVRIERYSMGSSINVTWIDGPMVKDVDEIAGHFHGSKLYLEGLNTSWTFLIYTIFNASFVMHHES